MFLPFPNVHLAIPDSSQPPGASFFVFPKAAHSAWLELALYLGAAFRPDWMGTTDVDIVTEALSYPTRDTFYASSERYLYHLTHYFLEGWKRPGYSYLLQLFAGARHITLLDYGCGIGSDGLWFLEQGFAVNFAEYDNPSRRYLAWRLAHRMQQGATLYDVEDPTIPRHHLVWCMDVLEHQPPAQQQALLAHLRTLGAFVLVNLVDDREADGVVHFPVDVEGLTAWMMAQGEVAYKDFYEQPNGSKVRFVLWDALNT